MGKVRGASLVKIYQAAGGLSKGHLKESVQCPRRDSLKGQREKTSHRTLLIFVAEVQGTTAFITPVAVLVGPCSFAFGFSCSAWLYETMSVGKRNGHCCFLCT